MWFQTFHRAMANTIVTVIVLVAIRATVVVTTDGTESVTEQENMTRYDEGDHDAKLRSTELVPLLHCVQNATCAELDNSRRYNYSTGNVQRKNTPTKPSIWCPEGFRALNGFLMCLPRPCVKVHNVTVSGNLSLPNGTKVIESVGEENSTITLCTEKFARHFVSNCTKSYLTTSEFEIRSDGSLWNRFRNETVPLGGYWSVDGKAVICDPDTVDDGAAVQASPQTGKSVLFPKWCMPFDVSSDHFQRMPNGTLWVGSIQQSVTPYYFRENGSVAEVCITMDVALSSCKPDGFGVIGNEEFKLESNMDVLVNRQQGVTFRLGHYMLTDDRQNFYFCIIPKDLIRYESRILYGVASTVSAVCLLLALIAHVFYPSLNYHTKTLLCLAFSLMIFYLMSAITHFVIGSFESAASNMIIFALRYIFGLSAFFWLTVISFDLWRVFSKLKGTFSSANNAQKRWAFIAKCIYAFGIPAVMYIILISIAWSPEAQQGLNFEIFPKERNWFTHEKTQWALFYGPIAILVTENLVLFILTIINIRKASEGTDLVNKRASKKLMKVYIKLFAVLGLCWILEVISAAVSYRVDEAVWYVTDLINCFQGVYIFLIYVCKKKTWILIQHKLGYISTSQVRESTSSTQDSSDRKTVVVNLDTVPSNGNANTATHVANSDL